MSVVFWAELTQWTKTTFAVTRSQDTRERNMDYTVKDEKPETCRSAAEEGSEGDMN